MDNLFKAAYLFKVLPDEVKKLNGIKANAKTPRFDLIGECTNGCDFVAPMMNPKHKVYLNLIPAYNVVEAHTNRRADLLLKNYQIGNLTSLYYFDNQNNGKYYGYVNPNPKINKGKDNNPLQRFAKDLLLIQISPDQKTLMIFVLHNVKDFQQYIYPDYLNGKYDEAIARKIEFMEYPYNYEGL
jgi:hypothetical protein